LSASEPTTGRLLLRNTLYLTISQALTIPISFLVNALSARYLGPEVFGLAYLAGTMCGLGFLAVSWGHEGVLPAEVARDHSVAGELLGSSLAWRSALGLVVYGVLALVCRLLGYGADFQWALALTALLQLFTSYCASCKDTIRGFERTDIPAIAHVAQQFLAAVLVVCVLLLGGRLRAALLVQWIACVAILIGLTRSLGTVGVGALKPTKLATKNLLKGGTPFVIFNIAMMLQPNIDAIFLSKLASFDAVGWYAVAGKIVGALLFPATALIGAFYPTLSRLYGTDLESFKRTSSGAMRTVSLLVVPVSLGCALYPGIPVAFFSRKSFGPAEDDLRLMAAYIFLLYFSMPLGTCVLAAGKQRAWSIVQSLCVITSLILDPILVPWFEKHMGNGGLGVCIGIVVSELVVVACGLKLAPAGIVDRRFLRGVALPLVAGVGMVAVARATHAWSPFISGPLALVAYVAALRLTGAVSNEELASLRGFVARRFSRSA